MKINFSDNIGQRHPAARLIYMGFFIFLILACVVPGSVPPTPIVITATPSELETPIPSPTSAVTATPPDDPSCTVLQDLNLRSGPGTAYNPPLAVLEADTEFVPTGFEPQGVPGGPWVQAEVEGTNQIGWVSAGQEFILCNVELTTLPEVVVAPPRAAPPRIGTGAVDGDGISNFRFSIDYNPEYFVRMYVFRSDDDGEVFSPEKDGRGITSVEFLVESLDETVEYLRRTEMTPGYCAFAGGEPNCNPWVYENGQYKWSAGGLPVQEGPYKLTITVTAADGVEGRWFIDINADVQ